MKKILFLLAILPMFLAGCSNDDEQNSAYTANQQKAISVFNGKFKAEISKGIFGGVFTKYIEFVEIFAEPKIMKTGSFMGEEIDTEVHGRAIFTDINGTDSERYFYIDRDAKNLYTHHKYENGRLDNEKEQSLNIKNENEFYLYDSGFDGDLYTRE